MAGAAADPDSQGTIRTRTGNQAARPGPCQSPGTRSSLCETSCRGFHFLWQTAGQVIHGPRRWPATLLAPGPRPWQLAPCLRTSCRPRLVLCLASRTCWRSLLALLKSRKPLQARLLLTPGRGDMRWQDSVSKEYKLLPTATDFALTHEQLAVASAGPGSRTIDIREPDLNSRQPAARTMGLSAQLPGSR